MKLYLLRHGETDWNAARRVQGHADTPLNEKGVRQAEALAKALRDVPFEAVHSSPLQRAMKTAEPLARGRGLTVVEEPGLMELDQGELDGLLFEEIARKHPEYLQRWIEEPASTRMPGGETLEELQARAWAAVTRMLEAHRGKTIAAAAHNFTVVAILCKALVMELRHFRRLVIRPASWSRVDFGMKGSLEPDLPRIVTINATGHLVEADLL